MPLTAEERKKLLGHGGLAKVARRARRSPSHVTHVNNVPDVRDDPVVKRAIAREILKKHPHIDPTDIWPAA